MHESDNKGEPSISEEKDELEMVLNVLRACKCNQIIVHYFHW